MDPVLFAHSQDSGKCLVRGPIGNTPVRQGLGVDLTLTWGRHPPKHRALPPGPAPAGAQVAELVDALVSGTSAARRGGSSPLLGTILLRAYALRRIAALKIAKQDALRSLFGRRSPSSDEGGRRRRAAGMRYVYLLQSEAFAGQ